MDESTIRETAERLERAEASRTPIPQLHLQYPDMTIEDAYAVQRSWTQMKIAAGRRVIGRKIGLTSHVMQASLGIDEPDYGALYDDMLFEDGGEVPLDRFIAPRLEVELAFVLGNRLTGPDCTVFDVLNATDYVTPALEILDARVEMTDEKTGDSRTIVDTIADNAADAGVLTGGRAVRPDAVDLRWVAALLSRNGSIEESGVAAAVLNHPARGVAWLANRLTNHGLALEAGDLILSGSFTRALWIHPGDVFQADFGPLGTISARFR